MTGPASTRDHSVPHFNAAGFCVCSCADCTARTIIACVCLDCPCSGDYGEEHLPDGCGELEPGPGAVASMPGGLGPPGWLKP